MNDEMVLSAQCLHYVDRTSVTCQASHYQKVSYYDIFNTRSTGWSYDDISDIK